MDEVKAGIKYAFQTENQWTVCVSGTGNLAPTHIACYHNDVGSESDITPCIKIDKPLVVYRFWYT